MQAARQALGDETKRFVDVLGKRHPLLRGAPISGSGCTSGARPAAIGMLDERLREIPVQDRDSRRGGSPPDGDLDGVEGTDDEPLLSPFSRNEDERSGSEWNGAKPRDASATEASGMPSSAGVRMLERRLNQETEPVKKTDEKKSNPHKKSKLMDVLR